MLWAEANIKIPQRDIAQKLMRHSYENEAQNTNKEMNIASKVSKMS